MPAIEDINECGIIVRYLYQRFKPRANVTTPRTFLSIPLVSFFQFYLGLVLHRSTGNSLRDAGSNPDRFFRIIVLCLFIIVAFVHLCGDNLKQVWLMTKLVDAFRFRSKMPAVVVPAQVAGYQNDRRWIAYLDNTPPLDWVAFAILFVFFDMFIVGWVFANGLIFLWRSPTNSDLLLNSVALEFIFDLDDYAIAVIKNLGDVTHDYPAEVRNEIDIAARFENQDTQFFVHMVENHKRMVILAFGIPVGFFFTFIFAWIPKL